MYKLVTLNNLKTFKDKLDLEKLVKLDGGTAIPENADLNTYTTVGNYTHYSSNDSTITHMPYNTTYFRLYVIAMPGTDTVIQVFLHDSITYIRTYTTSWGSWARLATTAYVDSTITNATAYKTVRVSGNSGTLSANEIQTLRNNKNATISRERKIYYLVSANEPNVSVDLWYYVCVGYDANTIGIICVNTDTTIRTWSFEEKNLSASSGSTGQETEEQTITLSDNSGTLTTEQLTILRASKRNTILRADSGDNRLYHLVQVEDVENDQYTRIYATAAYFDDSIKMIKIDTSTRKWSIYELYITQFTAASDEESRYIPIIDENGTVSEVPSSIVAPKYMHTFTFSLSEETSFAAGTVFCSFSIKNNTSTSITVNDVPDGDYTAYVTECASGDGDVMGTLQVHIANGDLSYGGYLVYSSNHTICGVMGTCMESTSEIESVVTELY